MNKDNLDEIEKSRYERIEPIMEVKPDYLQGVWLGQVVRQEIILKIAAKLEKIERESENKETTNYKKQLQYFDLVTVLLLYH